jgi:hypothetical protein
MNAPVLVLETLAGGCFLVSAALTYKEIGEINRKLPDDKQISYFFFHLEKMMRIRREYKRLYPQGSLDRLSWSLSIAGIIFLILAAIATGFFNHLPPHWNS